MITPSYKHIGSLLVLCTLFLPSVALASSVYVDTTRSEFFVGDTILFSVRIDSEGKNINAAEGELLLDHAANVASLTDITTSGSAFSLWPRKPLPSERNTRISFAGGSPGGLISKDAIMFTVVLKLQEPGQIALSPDNIGVYLHDGKGTRDSVRVKDFIINVLPKKPGAEAVDDWNTVVLNDKTPPEPFEVYLGQETSVFDGKKFLSFSTTDAQSGISHYEVREGNLLPIRSNETYVLQDQYGPVKVTVIAYDSAGNARESVYTSATYAAYSTTMIPIGIILIVILLIVIFKKIRRVRK